MRGNGERKRRREERCSKSQEGGIYVDVGEIHHPPSLAFFFFITEGKQGPPQSLPHHHKYGGEMCVGRNAQEMKTGEENSMAGKREALLEKDKKMGIGNLFGGIFT